jgi:hypothetical protein
MFNGHFSTGGIMSTNAISGSNQLSLSALFGGGRVSQRHRDDDGERESSGGNVQAITLLASLLQALTQAATAQAAPASSPAAVSTTPSVTSTVPASGSTPSNSLVQDLQAFLHDLFYALRHADRGRDGERTVAPGAQPTTTPAATPPVSTPLTPPVSTPPVVGTANYRHHGIISALQALIQDFGAGQSSGSSGALTRLNAAFVKLIGDLGGNASAGPAAGSSGSTSALQSFLTNFLQDLQNNGAHSLNPLGSSVDTTA